MDYPGRDCRALVPDRRNIELVTARRTCIRFRYVILPPTRALIESGLVNAVFRVRIVIRAAAYSVLNAYGVTATGRHPYVARPLRAKIASAQRSEESQETENANRFQIPSILLHVILPPPHLRFLKCNRDARVRLSTISFLVNDLFFCWSESQMACPCNPGCIIETGVAEYNTHWGNDHLRRAGGCLHAMLNEGAGHEQTITIRLAGFTPGACAGAAAC
jgi:hypothetical protein